MIQKVKTRRLKNGRPGPKTLKRVSKARHGNMSGLEASQAIQRTINPLAKGTPKVRIISKCHTMKLQIVDCSVGHAGNLRVKKVRIKLAEGSLVSGLLTARITLPARRAR
jgi:hypothetical protein